MATPYPLSGSDVRLYSSVRFARDYSHVRWFETYTERANYFDSLNPVDARNNVTFIKHSDMQGIYRSDKQLETLQNASYMVFDNEGQKYYCFIDNLEYVNEKCTNVYFSVDVMQTNLFKLSFNQSLVEREHCQRYLSNGQPVINTIPEGLNYGDDYITKSVDEIQPFNPILFMVVVCKQPFHIGAERVITATDNGISQGLTYYIHPFYPNSASQMNVKIGGTAHGISDALNVLNMMYRDEYAVNNVVSIYITENTGLSCSFTDGYVNFISAQIDIAEFVFDNEYAHTLYVKSNPRYSGYTVNLGNKYDDVEKFEESKLLMYPYTTYVMTDLKGSQIEIKPELINTSRLEIVCYGSLGTSNKTSYMVEHYKSKDGYFPNDRMHNYNEGLISETPSTIPVISDYLAAYLQGNANSIQTKMNSIFVNGVFDAVAGVGGIAASAATRNIGGAASGAVGVGQNFSNSLLSFQAISSQLKDIRNIPPNLNNQGNNVNFDYGNALQGVYIIKKQIRPEYAEILTDYFRMFGYKVNKLKHPNLKTRRHFNYIKMVEPNIIANVPLYQMQLIKDIFKNGVTLWHTNDMLNYNVTNNEI